MSKTSDTQNDIELPLRVPPDREFCRWFWHHSKKEHGVRSHDFLTTRTAAQRLFQCFDSGSGFQSEDEAIHSMRRDRAGTLSLSDATVCAASLAGWDLSTLGTDLATKPSLKWDNNIFQASGAWWFFRKAIEEHLWPA